MIFIMYKRRNEYRDDRGKFFHKVLKKKKENLDDYRDMNEKCCFFFSKEAKD